jgi:4,5-DOPA dioxygenase extradiol
LVFVEVVFYGMKKTAEKLLSPVMFIPHGGGPLPLLGDTSHVEMVDFLGSITPGLGLPSAIIVISAHWEESIVTITGGEAPSLIYDYYGFPDESYEIKYPAAGHPELAQKVHHLLQDEGIDARLDNDRGFDHGLFVPLKIMFPQADIPCIEISLLNSLDTGSHLQIGRALSKLRNDNVLIIGSGLSFHNMQAFLNDGKAPDEKNEEFERWLIDTCTNSTLTEKQRAQKLLSWEEAPSARYCHPREEHLLPLQVCYGICGSAAKLVFEGKILGKRASAFLW